MGYSEWHRQKKIEDSICKINCETDDLRRQIEELRAAMGRPAISSDQYVPREYVPVYSDSAATLASGTVVMFDDRRYR